LHLLLEDDGAGLGLAFRRLVLGEAALHHGTREDADEPAALLHDRYPLQVFLLEEAEGTLELEGGVEREVGRLRDLAQRHSTWIQSRGDHSANERFARDDAD